MNDAQTREVDLFFNKIINPQIAFCEFLINDFLDSGFIRLSLNGMDKERLLIDININAGFFAIPQNLEEFRTDYFFIGKHQFPCKRYSICCESKTQANQVLELFKSRYKNGE